MPPLAEVGKLSAPRAAGFCSAPHQRQKVSVPKGMHCLTKIFGSGSLEQDSLIQIIDIVNLLVETRLIVEIKRGERLKAVKYWGELTVMR